MVINVTVQTFVNLEPKVMKKINGNVSNHGSHGNKYNSKKHRNIGNFGNITGVLISP